MRRFYVPQLDGLRFLAILLVMAHHGPTPWAASPGSVAVPVLRWFHRWGWCGVDLFLVLSAFLITTLLLLEHEERGAISLRNFYVRRILRIWPLYYFGTTLGFFVLPAIHLLAPAWQSPEHHRTLSDHLLAYYTLFGNFSCGIHGYPPIKVLVHLWTVTLEEQFYIGWPVLMVFLLRARNRTVRWFALPAMLALSFALRWYCIGHTRHPFIYTNTLTHLDPLVMGIALAFWRQRHPAGTGGGLSVVKALAGGALVYAISTVSTMEQQSEHVLWQYPVLAAGFVLLLDSTLATGGNPIGSFFSVRPLVWLGKVTYGLYVYHMFCLMAAEGVVRRLPGLFAPDSKAAFFMTHALALAATVTCAALSYRFFESYFLRLKGKFSLVRSGAASQVPAAGP